MWQKLMLLIIKIYARCFSFLVGNCCRFHPSCSVYAHDAINKFGGLRGGWLAFKRVARCNPWCYGGDDPIP